jgi:ABC-type branched-subunit amino acid transport system permease subunit
VKSVRSVAATLAMARARPSHAAKELSPARPASYIGYSALVCVVAVVAYQINPYQAGLLFIYGLSALGLDWIVGWAGQASLANGPLMAIGAIETAYISTRSWGNLGFSVVAALVTGLVVGIVIGLPAVRIRGLYLVMVTLALQFIVVDGMEISQERLYCGERPYRMGIPKSIWQFLFGSACRAVSCGIPVFVKRIPA